jgi:hypothetical protein
MVASRWSISTARSTTAAPSRRGVRPSRRAAPAGPPSVPSSGASRSRHGHLVPIRGPPVSCGRRRKEGRAPPGIGTAPLTHASGTLRDGRGTDVTAAIPGGGRGERGESEVMDIPVLVVGAGAAGTDGSRREHGPGAGISRPRRDRSTAPCPNADRGKPPRPADFGGVWRAEPTRSPGGSARAQDAAAGYPGQLGTGTCGVPDTTFRAEEANLRSVHILGDMAS